MAAVAMPVRPGGDQHRVDVAAGEQLAQVAVHGAIGVVVAVVGAFLDGLAARFFDVANGDELHVLLRQEAIQVVAAPVADADAAHDDAFAWGNAAILPQDTAGDDLRQREQGAELGGGLEKTASAGK